MTRTAHKVADADALSEDGDRVLVDIDGREVAVFRTDGECYALANFCPHQAGPLCEGPLHGRTRVDKQNGSWEYDESGDVIACPWHGWEFDVKTGANMQTNRYRVPTYDVETRDDGIYVML